MDKDNRAVSPASATDTLGRGGKVVHTRSRRGCLTCRTRHIKCDESVPTCGSCKRLHRDCNWGLKLSFNVSRVTRLSERESTTLRSIESRRSIPKKYNFVNEAKDAVREESRINSTQLGTSLDTFPAPKRHGNINSSIRVLSPSANEVEAIDGLETSESEDAGAASLYNNGIGDRLDDLSTPEGLYRAPPNYKGLSYIGIPDFITDHSVKSKLISCYFKNVSRWCELTDSVQTFTAVHGRLVVHSRCFGPAALAVSAKYLENTGNLHEGARLSSQLYEHAISVFQDIFNPQDDPTSKRILFGLTCVMLSLYCAMTLCPEDVRTQLYSYINAMQLHTWKNPLDPTSSACFWAMARLDLWAAYQCRQPTLIYEELWLNFSSADSKNLQDHWAKRVMCTFSRIVNQLSRNYHAPGVFPELWEVLQSWVIERPECMQPVLELQIAEQDAFPVILFSNSAATCGNIFYHTSCILLLETSQLQAVPHALPTISNPLCHARRIGAISISNDQSQWVNNIEPISIAARHYVTPQERFLVLKHLKEIATCTGWVTTDRSRELRILWGLE